MSARSATRLVNIPRSVMDPHYPFKMPEIVVRVAHRGRWPETDLVNICDIADALHRPPSYPTKFIAIALGTRTSSDPGAGRYSLRGEHSFSRVAALLDTFVARYVLCRQCMPGAGNPCTTLALVPGTGLALRCSCERVTPVGGVELFDAYAAQHPPRAQRRPPRSYLRADSSSLPPPDAVAEPTQEEKEDDGEWSVDTSSDAVQLRAMAALGSGTSPSSEETEQRCPQESVAAWVSAVGHASARGDAAALGTLAADRDGEWEARGMEVVASAFGAGVLRELYGRVPLLKPFARTSKGRRALLESLSKLCEREPSIAASVPAILAGLYEKDLLEEDDVLSFFKSETAAAGERLHIFTSAAAPFVAWLESEGDD